MKEGDLVVCVDDSPWGTTYSSDSTAYRELKKGKPYFARFTDTGVEIKGLGGTWRKERFVKIEV